MIKGLSKAELAKLLGRWKKSPAHFAEDVFGADLWSGQRDFLNALATERRLAIPSGHKTGKTWAFAAGAWWHVLVHGRYPQVCVIAPRISQIENGTWKNLIELYGIAKRRGFDFGCRPIPRKPSAGITWDDHRAKIWGLPGDGIGTRGEALQGLSGNVVYALDESVGLSPLIWEVATTTAGGRIWAVGNPTTSNPENPFYQACQPGSEYRVIRLSSADAAKSNPKLPNGEWAKIGFANEDDVQRALKTHGLDSYYYQVRVLGNFPPNDTRSFIPADLVAEAQKDWTETEPSEGELHIGVDPAWSLTGDDTGIVVTRGNWAASPIAIRGKTDAIVAHVVQIVAKYRRGNEPVFINCDYSNNAGVCDNLETAYRHDLNVTVTGLPSAGHTDKDDARTGLHCARLRDELWVTLRDWLETAAIPADRRLIADILTPGWDVDSSNALKIEDKKSIRKRLKRSTDRADALALAVYSPPKVHSFTYNPSLFDSESP